MSDDTTRRGRTTFTAALLVVVALALPVGAWGLTCGDGILDVLEDCDEGPANGDPDSCCTILCTFVPADTQCRDTTGECDPADVCSGTSGVCDDVKRTDVCRPVAGVCDVEELCDGVASDCPADDFEPASVECRGSAGICDLAEDCTGSSAACPANAKSTAECRPSAGPCDVAEICNGVSNNCPANHFEPASVECRASAGVCDTAEDCTGSTAACPGDAKSTSTCRPSAGICDVAESCDGSGDDCPADDFEPASVECRGSAGICDLAESCTGSSADCPANAKSTAECRPSAGPCDVAEICNGVSNNCPANHFEPASVECRASAGVCDIAEHCTGSTAACPGDAKSTSMCRPSAGICDVAESCNGSGDDCPANDFEPASVECRASAGVCDVAEQCTGSSAACPSDGFEPASLECRAAANQCDVAELCTGASAACPSNAFQPDETSCDDANSCSINDRCIGGVCGGFLENCGNGVVDAFCAEDCDDSNTEEGDGCHECQFEACHPEPSITCRATNVAGKAPVLLLSRLNPDKNKMQWKYMPGATTPKSDFGNPLADTSYQFCIWEEVAGDPRLAASYAIPAGGTCGTNLCWKENKSGFKYSDRGHTSNGISGLLLKQGLGPGKSKIILAGKGANLPLPVMPLVQGPNVVMQIFASNGTCWETRYGAPASRNQPDQFRDK